VCVGVVPITWYSVLGVLKEPNVLEMPGKTQDSQAISLSVAGRPRSSA
jgi:hypothetical protein